MRSKFAVIPVYVCESRIRAGYAWLIYGTYVWHTRTRVSDTLKRNSPIVRAAHPQHCTFASTKGGSHKGRRRGCSLCFSFRSQGREQSVCSSSNSLSHIRYRFCDLDRVFHGRSRKRRKLLFASVSCLQFLASERVSNFLFCFFGLARRVVGTIFSTACG